MILIGSKAIKYWYPDFPREGKDTDYVVKDNLKSSRETEYLLNPILCDYIGHRSMYHNTQGIATPNELYTLKLSHMFWDINWNKHLYDIQWLKEKGCKIIEPLFYKLYDYWNEYHSKNKRSDLKMTANEFFNNTLKSDYSHDWLHTLIKNVPTYTKILCDGAEVEVCKEKFNQLSFEDKCSLVREEVYVMSWERVPNWNYRKAYEMMLKKFIISHAPIWESIFILDNYKYLYKPEINHFKLINNKLKEYEL